MELVKNVQMERTKDALCALWYIYTPYGSSIGIRYSHVLLITCLNPQVKKLLERQGK